MMRGLPDPPDWGEVAMQLFVLTMLFGLLSAFLRVAGTGLLR